MGLPGRNLQRRLEFSFFWLLLHISELQGLIHLNEWCNQVMSAMESQDNMCQNFNQTIVWAAGSSRRSFHQATWTAVDQYFSNALGKTFSESYVQIFCIFCSTLSHPNKLVFGFGFWWFILFWVFFFGGFLVCFCFGFFVCCCCCFSFAVSKLQSQKFLLLSVLSKPTNICPLLKNIQISLS